MQAILSAELSGGTLALLVVCLLIALGFEFVNGFHDAANAVATVIYTNALRPYVAVIFSGILNFLGVMLGGIAVALSIIHLLPVELLVSAGVGKGLAMVLALLIAAVLWNLGTWYLGLPASSSHTLIGAILGVGLMSSLLEGRFGTGVNWDKAGSVGLALLLSPIIGFCLAAVLVRLMHWVVRDKSVFDAPKGSEPPKFWVRSVLVLTCGAVSFAHGSNDGQKGVGLIMLILIGLVPSAYALDLHASAQTVEGARSAISEMASSIRPFTEDCAERKRPACVVRDELRVIGRGLSGRARLTDVPPEERWEVRQAFLRLDDAVTQLNRARGSAHPLAVSLQAQRARIAPVTDYAPTWVLIAVALALGVGTTVGWKRIVVTVGEKIGKTHLTYAQGASAEVVAASTIALSTHFGLPVSTTHMLSSGVAGTMAAEKSGLQAGTVKKIVLAWVLTLPATMAISAGLFLVFSTLLG